MSDCEETDFFWESWTSSGKRRRRKKDTKRDKKCLKCKNSTTMKADENIQKKKKKKKNPKFKEAMEGRKEKKKEKSKKKKRSTLGRDDSSVFTQAKPTVKPEALPSRSNDELKVDHLTQDSKKKTKGKKKVAFDLSPGHVCVKRSKFVSSSPQCPEENSLAEAVTDLESCSQVTAMGHGLGQTHDNASQDNSQDIDSQDLFITQKTFRASPAESSSGEASDKAIAATPRTFTRRDELHASVAQTKQHREGSYKSPQDSHSHFQHRRDTKEHAKKTVQVLLTEEEEEDEGFNKARQNPKKGKLSFQTQTELNANLTKEKEVSCPVHIKPRVVNPYLDEPTDVNPESKKQSCSSGQQPVTNASTQTENFFTTELSSYLNICQKRRVPTRSEDFKPLDLSLQRRARKDLEPHSSSSSDMKGVEVKKEASGQHPYSASTHGEGETALSPRSQPESKSADTTTSSEDGEPPCRTGKLDLTQVRAVQMRLNECFFFKAKGEGQSPRPASPLMKLALSREVKSRKGH